MATIRIPSKLKARLNKEHATIIDNNLINFSHILKEERLFFFPEYTDHGINHIEGVLKSIEKLISDVTFKKLSSIDICAIIIATVLHDIGMHTSLEMFIKMILGEYDHIPGNLFIEKTWKELWAEYLKDSRSWNQEKKNNVFGEKDHVIKVPNLDKLQSFDGYDKKFIGEFIRIHHARLAYEIALKGFIGNDKLIIFDLTNNQELNNKKFMQAAGLIARSHGMNVRDTFDYLIKLSGKSLWKTPIDIKVVFLMILIRIGDYIQIDATRTDELMLKLRIFYSPYSLREHKTHLAIDCVHYDNDDKEKIVVEASPKDAQMYVKINNLVKDIQKELDLSWAILGEVYGNEFKLKYRRIESNLTDEDIKNGYDFVPNLFGLKFNNKLSELLIEPLYGNDPSFGVRELVQNAVDACRTRLAIDPNYCETIHVRVDLDTENKLFTIEDSGIGMTIDEIDKFFLTIGSSYDSSIEWQKTRDTERIFRTGRFGIGVLAAFLLGNTITVETRSTKSMQGYAFTASLQDSFIIINKIKKDDFGTKITIKCNESSCDMLEKAALARLRSVANTSVNTIWTDWYVDDIPKAVYFINDVQIPICFDSSYFEKLKYHFLESKTEQMDVRYRIQECHGMPLYLHKDAIGRELMQARVSLFINGFIITQKSGKRLFNLQGLEKYYNFAFPSLYINDNHNRIPLNLQRSRIDEFKALPFEKELAIDMYKDLICRLLAIDLSKMTRHKSIFFNSSGFTLNISPNYPFSHKDASFVRPYSEGFLLGKFIIHIGGVHLSKKNMDVWKDLFDLCPEAFFLFHDHEYNYLNRIHTVPTNKYFNRLTLAVNSSEEFEEFNNSIIENRENIIDDEILNSSFHKSPFAHIIKNNYYIYHRVGDDYDERLVEKVLSFFQKEGIPEPAFILTHKIEGNNYQSDVDDFFEKYAGGDLIIPYEEVDRKIKFEEIYKECDRIIEQYKESYEQKPLEEISIR